MSVSPFTQMKSDSLIDLADIPTFSRKSSASESERNVTTVSKKKRGLRSSLLLSTFNDEDDTFGLRTVPKNPPAALNLKHNPHMLAHREKTGILVDIGDKDMKKLEKPGLFDDDEDQNLTDWSQFEKEAENLAKRVKEAKLVDVSPPSDPVWDRLKNEPEHNRSTEVKNAFCLDSFSPIGDKSPIFCLDNKDSWQKENNPDNFLVKSSPESPVRPQKLHINTKKTDSDSSLVRLDPELQIKPPEKLHPTEKEVPKSQNCQSIKVLKRQLIPSSTANRNLSKLPVSASKSGLPVPRFASTPVRTTGYVTKRTLPKIPECGIDKNMTSSTLSSRTTASTKSTPSAQKLRFGAEKNKNKTPSTVSYSNKVNLMSRTAASTNSTSSAQKLRFGTPLGKKTHVLPKTNTFSNRKKD